MRIDQQQLNIGAYYVIKVDTRSSESLIISYHSDYTTALDRATYNYSSDSGYKVLVVEVQGIIQPQGVPEVVTLLTKKL